MTDKEIVQALHICGEGHPCRDCQLYGKEISCVETLCKYALALIERLTAENVVLPDGQASAIESLRKEIEWKDMVIALAQRKQACAEAREIEEALSGCDYSISRMVELMEADKDGRVVVLPCRQGDELWTYCNHPVKRVYSFTVSDVSTLNGRTVLNTLGLGTIRPEDIGKTVFLTREEAKKALQEME